MWVGNGEGHTLLILTDTESRLIHALLIVLCVERFRVETADECLEAFNRGIARGTARLQQEFKDEQARKRGKK